MNQSKDTYVKTDEYWFNDHIHVIINRPILTDEERARRMKIIEKAAARLLLSLEKAGGEIDDR